MTGGAAHALWVSARHQVALFLTARQSIVIQSVVQPVALLLATLEAAGPGHALQRTSIAIGVMLISYWTSTVWNSASILTRERAEGTLSASVIGVRSQFLILAGRTLAVSAVSSVLASATVMATLAVMGRPLAVRDPVWLVTGMVGVLVSGTALGALLACVFLLSRYGQQLSSALMYPVFLLGGLVIPLRMFPAWLRWPAGLISLHWTGQIMAAGAEGASAWPALGMTCLLTGVYALAGALMHRRISRLATEKGTLDLV